MNFNKVLSYVLLGASTFGAPKTSNAQTPDTDEYKFAIATPVATTAQNNQLAFAASVDKHFNNMYSTEHYLNIKADELCETYMDNMLDAQQRLAPYVGKRGYTAAVRRELPGAPVGLHCVYGQYTQLQRALDEKGDTLTIIPENARRACATFKSDMRRKYNEHNGYSDCIFEGKMFPSDSAYNVALNAYLTRNKITPQSPQEQINKFIAKFAATNWSVESVEPGTMLIVPRTPGSKTRFHMIMLVGRGIIENGNFVPDPSGKWVFTAHNKERLGYLFDAWDTSNVFAANTYQIVRETYKRELKKLDNMDKDQLINFLTMNGIASTAQLSILSIYVLRKMAHDKYFEKYLNNKNNNNNNMGGAVAQNIHTIPQWVYTNARQNTL